jgi:hypothetical protein
VKEIRNNGSTFGADEDNRKGQIVKRTRALNDEAPVNDENAYPLKIRRSIPLSTKSSDPIQCLDRIDAMYQIYFELEVDIQNCYESILSIFTTGKIPPEALYDKATRY